MSSEYTTYQGQKILLCNHAGLRGAPLLDSLKFATQMTQDDRRGQLLVLADFSNTYADDAVMAYLQSAASKQAAKNAKKMAVVGITGLKKLFLQTYNAVTGVGAKPFDDPESAKQYLMS